MVNQDIVNYIKEGKKRGFSVQLLKKKLLEAGFPERDVDDGISGAEETKLPEKIDVFAKPQILPSGPAGQMNNNNGGLGEKKIVQNQIQKTGSRFGWLKISAIIGAILFLSAVALGIIGFFAGDFFSQTNPASVMSIILTIAFVLLTFFYYFGFVKLSKHVNERSLKIGAWFIIIPIIIYLILAVVVGVIAYRQASVFLSGGEDSSFKIIFLVVSIVWVVSFLLHVVGQFLFSVGLIKTGKQVKFAKAAGILNIISSICLAAFVVGMVILIYSILNLFSQPLQNLDVFGQIANTGLIAVYSFIAFYILKVISFVFEILTLFDASKRFE